MKTTHSLSVRKPVSVWNKPLRVDFKEFFKSLSKAGANAATFNWGRAASDAIDALSAVGLEKDGGEVAWLLIHRSLIQAIYSLVEENAELLNRDAGNPAVVRRQLGVSPDDPEAVTNWLDLSLEKSSLTIDASFFKRPRELPILEEFKKPFAQWLEIFGLSEAEARSIANRLPSYFVYALNDQWRTRPEDYAVLKELVNTPFTRASEREQAWSRYSAWLQKQVDERMFYEAFSLKQVYVPLRAYYEERPQEERQVRLEAHTLEAKSRKRTVVDLEQELEGWLKRDDADDAVRLISGGPGSGKSSFTKMLAARLAERDERRLLFVPLHHFELTDDLEDAIRKFVRYDPYLPPNPLDPEDNDSKLLIIFDGLDELAMQGKAAAELAQQFVREVLKKTYQFNLREPRLKVLISGRELVIQANATEFRKPQQILHALPYFVPEDSRKEYTDSQKLLQHDQRQQWWTNYGKASGRDYKGLPAELNDEKLLEITSQPLLNYLVALSYTPGQFNLSAESNLNVIYEDLLKAVYQRGWAKHQHPSMRGVTEDQFIRLLEEIAVAAWHGDGRTTTVKEIEEHCESSGVLSLLHQFQEDTSKGITRLLMAFYFRGAGARSLSSEKTFEFTHKSFAEYLTARRIVRLVARIQTELESPRTNIDSGWDEREALTHWIRLCGPMAIDHYLLSFIRNEVRLFKPAKVAAWQEALCGLVGFEVAHGLPLERLGERANFREETRRARNAEESLLVTLGACALFTELESEIVWPSTGSFGALFARLQGQRASGVFCQAFTFLSLKDCMLRFRGVYGANFYRANLSRADLSYSNFLYAFLHSAVLQDAYLSDANLNSARLREADLRGAKLYNTSLRFASLQGADLRNAHLDRADLRGANFENAKLEGASFEGAIFDSVAQKRELLRAAKPAKASKRKASVKVSDKGSKGKK
ncbi:MAG TPA: pentapeptide repeat-containing protein [Pyrinomonadaceae bacterium]